MLLKSSVALVLPSVAAAAAAAAAESARDYSATRHEKTLYPPRTIPARLFLVSRCDSYFYLWVPRRIALRVML